MSDLSAIVFAVGSGLLLVVAALILLQALLHRDPLRGSLVVILVGLAAALAYETYALWTNNALTISRITALQFQAHPVPWLLILAAVMLATGGVVIDFVRRPQRAVWVLGAGAGASVIGGWVAHWTRWLP